MTSIQKIIKYLAIAFAMFLIIAIISSILFGVYIFSNILGLTKNIELNNKPLEEITINSENITNTVGTETTVLKLELGAINLQIRNGDTLKVESNNSNILCTQNNNQLIIKEKSKNFISINNNNNDLIIYVPEDMVFDKVKIEAGAGEIKIESLKTNDLSFEMGAGKVEIQKLNVLNKAEVEGGAGKTEILSGEINNLDLDLGIGEYILNSKLAGRNEISAGVGSIKINLTDGVENYTIKASKGIGSIVLGGKEISDNTEYGTGDTYIKIEGGLGSIEIN